MNICTKSEILSCTCLAGTKGCNKTHSTKEVIQAQADTIQQQAERIRELDAQEREIKRALYERAEIAISHAKVAPDPFQFLCTQLRAMYDTEFSVQHRSTQPTDTVTMTRELEKLIAAAESVCKSLEHPTESVNAAQMWNLRDALTAIVAQHMPEVGR